MIAAAAQTDWEYPGRVDKGSLPDPQHFSNKRAICARGETGKRGSLKTSFIAGSNHAGHTISVRGNHWKDSRIHWFMNSGPLRSSAASLLRSRDALSLAS